MSLANLRVSSRVVLLALWIATSAGSLFAIQSYKSQPGAEPRYLSDVSSIEDHVPEQYRILIFVHPQCPCTAASLEELEHVVRKCLDVPKVEIVVCGDYDETNLSTLRLARRMASIPNSRIRRAEAGEALIYGARTSGHVVAFDREGAIRYQGGITRARGHEGESPGGRVLFAILHNLTPEVSSRPVFGCELE